MTRSKLHRPINRVELLSLMREETFHQFLQLQQAGTDWSKDGSRAGCDRERRHPEQCNALLCDCRNILPIEAKQLLALARLITLVTDLDWAIQSS